MQWHWFSPSGIHNNAEWPWYKSFYTKATNFDVSKIFVPSSNEYGQMIDDIDLIAQFLLELQRYDIPVLWRPLHETAGKWFWWGAAGKKAYFELWHTMYERLTNYHGLNNLIWVWNGENGGWYVGDDYADMVSYDCYEKSASKFQKKAKRVFGYGRDVADDRKIVALSECGTVPSLSDFSDNNIRWSWFAIWCYEFIMKDGVYSEEYTSRKKLSEVYNHDLVITRDELGFVLFDESVD